MWVETYPAIIDKNTQSIVCIGLGFLIFPIQNFEVKIMLK